MAIIKDMSEAEIKALAAKIAEWSESPEGRFALQSAMERAEATIRQLEESHKCTWKQLNTPMSI